MSSTDWMRTAVCWHHHGREQVRLDRLAQQQPQHHGGHEADEYVQREALRLALRGQGHQRIADALPVDKDDGEDRAGLDGDVEDLGLGIVEAEQRAGEDQVACGGDGKEFGQALDHAHDGGLGQQKKIHAGVLRKRQERGLSIPTPAKASRAALAPFVARQWRGRRRARTVPPCTKGDTPCEPHTPKTSNASPAAARAPSSAGCCTPASTWP
jgi:hypothetical protein